MIRLKILILLSVIFLTLKSNLVFSQTYDSSKKVVELPLKKYIAIRNKLLTQDTVIKNNISIIYYKDSLLCKDSLKELSYNKELINKRITIDTLTKEYKNLSKDYNKLNEDYSKEKKSFLNNYKFWIGLVCGVLLERLITK